jgi:hypothetical protein
LAEVGVQVEKLKHLIVERIRIGRSETLPRARFTLVLRNQPSW